MPPKVPPPPSGQPKSALPLPPAVPVSSNAALVQPRPFERKGEPEGDDGYSSEGDDPPADYYHGMWRALDRSRSPDAKERKNRRDTVVGWNRTDRLGLRTPRYLIHSDEHVFKQGGGYCMANCGAYTAMRRKGFSPVQIISVLKRPAIAAQIEAWQKKYVERSIPSRTAGRKANEITDVFTFVENGIDNVLATELPSSWQLDSKAPAGPGGTPPHLRRTALSGNIVFPQLIGAYPSITPHSASHKTSFSVHYGCGENIVKNQPRMPSTVGATSFHQALFANFQTPRQFTLPHPKLTANRMMTREPTALVLLQIGYRTPKNVTGSHVMLADFTDSEHPGLFDPNFGWMEPKQGFCYLDFEQAMHSVWECYTSNNLESPRQGLGHLKVAEGDTQIFILAYQLYVQSI